MTAGSSSNTSSSFFSFSSNCSSSSSSSSGSPLTSCLYPWYLAAGVVLAVSCLLGVPANVAVIVKLSRHLRGSSISQRLFFNLALSDLLCLLCLMLGAVVFYLGPRFSHAACQFLFYCFVFCISSSSNILVLISIQRYYQVLHPKMWTKVTRTWQRFLLSSVWMLAALVALPAVFLLREVKTEQTYDRSCRDYRITPALEATYISFAIVSHLVLLSFYLKLVRGVNRIQMSDRRKPRVTQLFIRIIAASLVVGFLPLILRVFYVTASLRKAEYELRVSKMLTFVECFYFFNYCLNPFLYFFASRQKTVDSVKRRGFLMALDDSC